MTRSTKSESSINEGAIMARLVTTDKKRPRLEIVEPRTRRRITPQEIEAGLGAERFGNVPSGGSPMSAYAVRRELFRRLRSTGGRPALDGAEIKPKIPMRRSEWKKLEELARRVEARNFHPTAAQLASVLLGAGINQFQLGEELPDNASAACDGKSGFSASAAEPYDRRDREGAGMRQRVLGTVTIGQAPRRDLVPILDRHLPAEVRQIHRGVLDGLAREEIDALYRPAPGEPVLVTRLMDGGMVALSRARVAPAVQRNIDALEAEGCAVVLLLCTGTFTGLSCRDGWLIEPDAIIPPLAAGLLGPRRLGIVVPIASQIGSESGKWQALQRPPLFAAASPYDEDLAALTEAARDLAARGAAALLLDCIGFTERHRQTAAESGLPVLLSNAIVAKAVGELL
jgi:protein AroM